MTSLYRSLIFTATLSLGISALAGEKFTKTDRLFTLKVKPLLSKKCNGCHGNDPKKIKGGYNMLTREKLLAGGEDIGSKVVTPGDGDNSFLLTAIRWEDPDFEMPPKENDRLTPTQIKDIETWIKGGAPWPDESTQASIIEIEKTREVTEDGVLVKTSGGLSDDWTYRRYQPENIWSFLPIKKPEVPEVDSAGLGQAPNPIDSFIRARQEKAGVRAAPPADPLTLLRRVTYDLTGLPPSPEEADQFLASWKKNATATWEKTVDRLLASPAYGENWARHWLDVVRYADTSGYSNDWERSNAWRYRDYVIRSLNQDKPWNQFIVEQLAGDEMEPENPEMKVAVGFLRMGPWEHTPMTPDLISRQLYLDDLTNVVGQAFLSTTMRCAKCHDHKFDPIPTRDYYRLYATFASTQPAEIDADFLPSENRDHFRSDKKHVEELLHFTKSERDRLYAKREAAAKDWYQKRGRPYKPEEVRRPLKEEKPPRFVGLSTEEEGKLKVREQDIRIWTRSLERYLPMAQSVYDGGDLYSKSEKLRLPNLKVKKQREKSEQIPQSFINLGGSVYAKGDSVTPGVLSAPGLRTSQGSDDDPYRLEQGMSGRRLSLARWIANPENPLTIRSIVNRVWHYHFGHGIARNPNNFGETGAKPSHPELLDYLAKTFVEDGWSLKKLHRRILTSQTWMESSSHPEIGELRKKDPNNELLAVFEPRRLTAEELRDSMLSNTGELNREMGGLPVKPEINQEVALSPRMIQFSLAPAYQASPAPGERNRRTIYARSYRGLPNPMLTVFNKPRSDLSCERRDAPSVTPQVFTMLNSATVTNRSIAFALRMQRDRGDIKDQISRGFELAVNRKPTDSELEKLVSHYRKMVTYHRGHQPQPVKYQTEITRSLVEELSGDPFEYKELLNAYQNYIPDKQASTVSPETRALADIAMLIFNTNEYVFLY